MIPRSPSQAPVAVAGSVSVSFDAVASARKQVSLAHGRVWVRVPATVKHPPRSKLGLQLEIRSLGRPMHVVVEVHSHYKAGMDVFVVQASTGDLVVLSTLFGPNGEQVLHAARQLLAPNLARPSTTDVRQVADNTRPGVPLPRDPASDNTRSDVTRPAARAPSGLNSAVQSEAGRFAVMEPTVDHTPAAPSDDDFASLITRGNDFDGLVVHDQAAVVSDRVLGIDLGTCNSCVCLVENGEPHIFTDAAGGETVPSVVSYRDNGSSVTGTEAVLEMPSNPERTIYGAKRFIGRPFNSAPVQQIVHKFPYKVVADASHGTAIEVNGEPRSLISVSAKILEHMRRIAESHTGQEVVRAVVTVPAYYNDNQRHAVKRAGSLAGLRVERIVDEPTAAAIAFGIDRNLRERKVLVYDLGGGTFDVSILSINGNDFRVIATAGDNFLGGEDFDNRIVDYIIEAYEEGYDQRIWSSHPEVRVRLKQAAERSKIALSDRETAPFELKDVPLITRGTCDVFMNLNRGRLESLVEHFVERTLFLADAALREANLDKNGLDAVLLVGGQTRMPFVRQRLKAHFGDKVRTDVDPAKAVAVGAALLAQSVEAGLPEVSLQAVLPMTIGLASPQHPRFRPVIPRNTQLPHVQAFQVQVPLSQWSSFTHDVFQGESADVRENEYLGTLQVYDFDPGPVNPVPLKIEFELTKECLLKVFVTNGSTGAREEVLLTTKAEAPTITLLGPSPDAAG